MVSNAPPVIKARTLMARSARARPAAFAKNTAGAGGHTAAGSCMTVHLETLAAVKKEIAVGTAADLVAAAKTAEPIVATHVASLESLART